MRCVHPVRNLLINPVKIIASNGAHIFLFFKTLKKPNNRPITRSAPEGILKI